MSELEDAWADVKRQWRRILEALLAALGFRRHSNEKGDGMADEITDDGIDVELDDAVEHAPLMDVAALKFASEARVERARTREERGLKPRSQEDIDGMLASYALELIGNHEQAIADAMALESEVRWADYERREVGQGAKDKTLAAGVRRGDFNLGASDE